MVEQTDKFQPMAIITLLKDMRQRVRDMEDVAQTEEWKGRLDGMKLALAWVQTEVTAMAFAKDRHIGK